MRYLEEFCWDDRKRKNNKIIIHLSCWIYFANKGPINNFSLYMILFLWKRRDPNNNVFNITFCHLWFICAVYWPWMRLISVALKNCLLCVLIVLIARVENWILRFNQLSHCIYSQYYSTVSRPISLCFGYTYFLILHLHVYT